MGILWDFKDFGQGCCSSENQSILWGPTKRNTLSSCQSVCKNTYSDTCKFIIYDSMGDKLCTILSKDSTCLAENLDTTSTECTSESIHTYEYLESSNLYN